MSIRLEDLMTVQEAAAELGSTPGEIFNRIHYKKHRDWLRSEKVGNARLVYREDIAAEKKAMELKAESAPEEVTTPT